MPWSPRGEVENRHCAREWRGYGATMLSILELPTVRQRVARISVEAYHVMSAQGWLDERTELLRGAIVEKMTKKAMQINLNICDNGAGWLNGSYGGGPASKISSSLCDAG